METQTQQLTIFHFNDVYNIQPYGEQPKAGAAYFNTLLQREKKKYKHALTLFSGDAFSPSLLSSEFEGENMVKPLQAFGIDLACYGNHDLDYDLQHVMKLTKKTNFPWLLSNVYDKRTQRRLAQGLQIYIFQKNNLKIGVFSLAEKEWIDTLYPYYKQICEYIPFIQFASKMVAKLRGQDKCDIVIALTHMMKYNDIKLAKSVKGIDLILGGHDHLIVHEQVNDTVLIKSGTDFKNFSIIKAHRKGKKTIDIPTTQTNPHSYVVSNARWVFQVQLKQVNHKLQNIQPDKELNEYIEQIYKQFKVKQQKIACFTKTDLDLRFKTIRKQPNPYLQFLVSVYRHECNADASMMSSGNLRMDTYIKAGPITFGVIQNVILDTITVKLVPAKQLLQALNVSVSMYPNLSGRYCSYSGIGFTWDASQKPGERVIIQSVKINDSPIDMNRIYKVSMFQFMAQGGDGYDCFKSCQELANDGDKYNRQIIHQLYHVNHFLLDTYIPKYPNRFKIIQYEGRECLELDLPKPKNVHMIMSTGNIYQCSSP